MPKSGAGKGDLDLDSCSGLGFLPYLCIYLRHVEDTVRESMSIPSLRDFVKTSLNLWTLAKMKNKSGLVILWSNKESSNKESSKRKFKESGRIYKSVLLGEC